MRKKLKDKKLDLENAIISKKSFVQSLQAYLGILKHCDEYGIEKILREKKKKVV